MSRTSLDPVHSGLNIASDVRVRTSLSPRVKTPFEGSVNGVQCGFVTAVEVGLGLAMLIICLSSIISERHGSAGNLQQFINGRIATWSLGCRLGVRSRISSRRGPSTGDGTRYNRLGGEAVRSRIEELLAGVALVQCRKREGS